MPKLLLLQCSYYVVETAYCWCMSNKQATKLVLHHSPATKVKSSIYNEKTTSLFLKFILVLTAVKANNCTSNFSWSFDKYYL